MGLMWPGCAVDRRQGDPLANRNTVLVPILESCPQISPMSQIILFNPFAKRHKAAPLPLASARNYR